MPARYLDVFLEQTWQENIRNELPFEVLQQIREDGIAAVQSYIELGTSMPDGRHWMRLAKERAEMIADLQAEAAELKDLLNRQGALLKRVQDARKADFQELDQRINDLEKGKFEAEKSRRSSATAPQSVDQQLAETRDPGTASSSKQPQSADSGEALENLSRDKAAYEGTLRLISEILRKVDSSSSPGSQRLARDLTKALEKHPEIQQQITKDGISAGAPPAPGPKPPGSRA